MKTGLFMDKGRELVVLSMKWGGFMDGMGIFEQKNEERRRRKKERKQEGRWKGREVERERGKSCAGGKGEESGFEGKEF